jgi:FkbM family methyltransferase
MGFLRKKAHLLVFLTRRIGKHGWGQWLSGIRDRKVSYTAMELAEVLPGEAQTIVDVGAHMGLVAQALVFLYRPSHLWAVEPNPALGVQLEERFKDDPSIIVVRSCLGEARGEVSFNAYDFDAASSVFACKAGHLAGLGFSEKKSSLTVPMTTLRELLPGDLDTLDLLKLDCQGAELAVLKGAGERIHGIRWIYCEVSIDSIYDGAPLWGDLHDFLRSNGFELRNVSGFAGTGATIQWADALYANARLVAK